MGLVIKATLGALVVLLIGVLAKTKNYYIAGLIPLFPTFALIAHYIVASERGIEALRATIVFGMWSIIPYFIYLLSLWYFTGFLRLPLALGGAVVGWILAWVNYSASSSVQPVEVLTTIKILFCVVPVVLYAGMFIMLSFYKLTDARVEAISQQLIKHRAAQGEAVPDAATAASH